MKKILLTATGITFVAFLFYLALGDGVAFYTQSLYNYIGNLIEFGIMLAQFVLHLVLLAIIKPKKTKTNFTNSKENSFFWIYATIAFAINVVIILMGTSDSRGVMSNERKWDNTEKYNWNSGISCPEGYPVYVLNGRFTIKSWGRRNNFPNLGKGLHFETWGEGNSGAITDEDLKIVMPDSLLATWYSIIDDKFYNLAVPLNKEKITALFKNGFESEYPAGRSHGTYDQITAGLAPGGTVAVWVGSVWENFIEVGLYKAKEIDTLGFDKYEMIDLRKDLAEEKRQPKSLLHKIEFPTKTAIPYRKWCDTYRKRYNWKFLFKSEFQLAKSDVKISMFNGERLKIDSTSLSETAFSMKALPSEIAFIYLSKKTGTERPSVLLEEGDVYNAFKTLAANNPNNPLTLICKMNKVGEITGVSLSNGQKSIGLKMIL